MSDSDDFPSDTEEQNTTTETNVETGMYKFITNQCISKNIFIFIEIGMQDLHTLNIYSIFIFYTKIHFCIYINL